MEQVTLYKILSSEGKLRVLKTLSDSHASLTLRQIESLTGLAIGSVQIAMPILSRQKIVQIQKINQKKYYKFNEKHPLAKSLLIIFETIEQNFIERRSAAYQKKAQAFIRFCSEQVELIRRARK